MSLNDYLTIAFLIVNIIFVILTWRIGHDILVIKRTLLSGHEVLASIRQMTWDKRHK